MSRITTAMVSQNALIDLQKSQKVLFEASNQTASQTKATDLKGYGSQTHTLVSSNRMIANIQSRIDNAAELDARLSMQDAVLTHSREVMEDLRSVILQDISLSGPSSIDAKIEEAFLVLKDSFNLEISGKSVFGGTRTDKPPVVAASVADLVANPIENAFEQGAQEQTVNVDGYQEISLAPVAAEAAEAAFDMLKTLAAGGPYGELTDAQVTALKGELAQFDTVIDGLVQLEARNGNTQSRITNAIERQTTQVNAIGATVGEITYVDLAEVAARLSNAQTTYQASASIFNTVRGLTLLDVL
ncbi:flagellin [Hirschia baltica]|uniref:Flagellin C-terminal domain-containing protein n=1 Tax=Hirschia baltica (strain ATCC 49814 / DSM 5838 / IFAM 1418) TaxID=582402 RepID=C6XM52_HIRBI|nr:flagellin [Hirschia baltica]ACT59884.1 hypothetical protein Hbal_2204 [Hirschia baltica ATCC 49814]